MAKQQHHHFLAATLTKSVKTEQDLEQIKSYLMKIPFFDKIFQGFINNEDFIYQLCEKIKYIETPPNTIIILQGDKKALELYIMLEGSVRVLIRDIPLNCNDFPLKDQIYKLQQVKNKEVFPKNSELTQKDKLNFWSQVEQHYGKTKASLNFPGILLGEMALIHQRPRAATIMTEYDSDFLILSKEDFDSVKIAYNEIELAKRQILIQSFPLIFDSAKYTRLYKEKCYRMFHDYKVNIDQIIINPQEQEYDYIYLIYSGEYSVEYFIQDTVKDQSKTENFDQSAFFKRQFVKGKYQMICLLSQGSTIGEEIIYDKKYNYRCKCVSTDGVLIRVTANELTNTFTNDNIQHLQNEYCKKQFMLQQMNQRQRSLTLKQKKKKIIDGSTVHVETLIKNRLKIKKQILNLTQDMTQIRIHEINLSKEESQKIKIQMNNNKLSDANLPLKQLLFSQNQETNETLGSFRQKIIPNTQRTTRNNKFFRIYQNQIDYADNFLTMALNVNQISRQILVDDKAKSNESENKVYQQKNKLLKQFKVDNVINRSFQQPRYVHQIQQLPSFQQTIRSDEKSKPSKQININSNRISLQFNQNQSTCIQRISNSQSIKTQINVVKLKQRQEFQQA